MNSMITITSHPNETDDVTLVGNALEGDVTAYGQLVERHQSLACSVALGICGDLHRSEDIAQEAFVAAWKQLRDLREPDKFKPWLCGIVRNLSHSSLRKDERVPVAETDAPSDERGEADDGPSPAEQTIDSEERAILLRQLQELPPLYREPMVLFYRQNESVASVAEALGLSEDAVKQRLSRGRAMLAVRIERTLGSVLRKTAPTAVFTLAVMGALGASTAMASAAAVTGAGAKMAKGTALSGTLAAPILVGAAGMWSLFRSQTESARTPRERRFAVWTLAGFTALGFVVSLAFGMRGIRMMADSSWLVILSFLIGVLVQSAGFAFGFWFYRRRQRIRLEDGMSADAARSVWRMEPEDKGFWPGVIGVALVLSSACNLPHILVVLDWVRTLVIALPLVLAGFAVAAMVRWPREWRRVLMTLISVLLVQYAGLTAYMWQQWSQSKEAWQHSIAIIAIQSCYLGIWVVTAIGCYLYWRSEKWGQSFDLPCDPTKDEM
jgi:RNA polymerase sigma factor (sigma-70 family)